MKKKKATSKLCLKDTVHTIKFLFDYLTCQDCLLMSLGLLMALVNGFVSPVSYIVLGRVVDNLLTIMDEEQGINTTRLLDKEPNFLEFMGSDLGIDTLGSNAMMYFVIGIISAITSFSQIACLEVVAERLVSRLRKHYLSQVLRQDLEWYDNADAAADLSTRLTDDLERVRDGLGAKMAMLVQLLTWVVVGWAVGLYFNWKLALVVGAATPVIFFNAMLAASITAQTTVVEQLKYSEAGKIASEVLTCVKTVAAFGLEEDAQSRYDAALEEGRKLTMSKYYYLAVSLGVNYGLLMIMYCAGLWFSAYHIKGELTPGDMATVLSALAQSGFTAALCLPMLVDIATAVGSAASVLPTIERQPRVDPYSDKGHTIPDLKGSIHFQGVKFAYPSRPQMMVLKGMDLEIPAGKIIALVGTSGAGKSTIVNLLMNFYQLSAGKILLDGVSLKDLNLKWLRSQVGIVSQEPVLFRTTVAENIRYGRQDADMEDIKRAAKLANAHSFIKMLPQGYGTEVGDRGTQLSGGQKQRIAIARALVRDPRVLLLDEATSALDSESEAVVQAALDNAMQGRTTVIIAHRLSTVRNADLICAMRDGVVVETGNHDQLMEKKGLYYELVQLQLTMDQECLDENKEERSQLTRSLSVYSTASSMGKASEAEERRRKYGVLRQIGSVLLVKGTPWHRITVGLMLILACGFAEPTLAVLFTQSLKTFSMSESQFWEEINRFIVGIGCLGLVVACSLFTAVFLCTTGTERMIQLIRVHCFGNMLSQQSGWFDDEDNMPNKLTNCLARDPPLIKGIIGGKFGMLVKSMLNIAVAVAVSYWSNWILAFVTFFTFALVMASSVTSLRLQVRKYTKESDLVQSGFKLATECIQNIKTVQQIGLQDLLIQSYTVLTDKACKGAMVQAVYYGGAFTLSSALVVLLNACLCHFGRDLLLDHKILALDLLRLIFLGAFTSPVIPIFSHFFNEFSRAVDPLKNISQLVRLKNDKFDTFSAGGIKPVLSGRVVVNKVKFSYPLRRDAPILKGLSLTVEAGQTVALVGPSGCGKSTIISLLERYYSPDHGKITLDGHELAEINLCYLRSQIGLVTQEPTLFDCTIRQNISYGAMGTGVTQEQIERAARLANIHEFIMSLPKGYDTQVGDRGAQMSGGQKQRIAIARALVRDPKILLLDEATSALDNQSEKVVQEALERAQQGRTCIVIAHRLSTVQNADKIVYICNGKVVEQGTHSQLLKAEGKYYDMVVSQRGGADSAQF